MFGYAEGFRPGKLQSTINLKINLAEIWDFYIEFMDWKCTTIQNKDDPKRTYDPYCTIAIDSPQAHTSQVRSEVQYNTNIPYWAKIKNGIIFRGTYHELKA